jgi:hypothetical protein
MLQRISMAKKKVETVLIDRGQFCNPKALTLTKKPQWFGENHRARRAGVFPEVGSNSNEVKKRFAPFLEIHVAGSLGTHESIVDYWENHTLRFGLCHL